MSSPMRFASSPRSRSKKSKKEGDPLSTAKDQLFRLEYVKDNIVLSENYREQESRNKPYYEINREVEANIINYIMDKDYHGFNFVGGRDLDPYSRLYIYQHKDGTVFADPGFESKYHMMSSSIEVDKEYSRLVLTVEVESEIQTIFDDDRHGNYRAHVALLDFPALDKRDLKQCCDDYNNRMTRANEWMDLRDYCCSDEAADAGRHTWMIFISSLGKKYPNIKATIQDGPLLAFLSQWYGELDTDGSKEAKRRALKEIEDNWCCAKEFCSSWKSNFERGHYVSLKLQVAYELGIDNDVLWKLASKEEKKRKEKKEVEEQHWKKNPIAYKFFPQYVDYQLKKYQETEANKKRNPQFVYYQVDDDYQLKEYQETEADKKRKLVFNKINRKVEGNIIKYLLKNNYTGFYMFSDRENDPYSRLYVYESKDGSFIAKDSFDYEVLSRSIYIDEQYLNLAEEFQKMLRAGHYADCKMGEFIDKIALEKYKALNGFDVNACYKYAIGKVEAEKQAEQWKNFRINYSNCKEKVDARNKVEFKSTLEKEYPKIKNDLEYSGLLEFFEKWDEKSAEDEGRAERLIDRYVERRSNLALNYNEEPYDRVLYVTLKLQLAKDLGIYKALKDLGDYYEDYVKTRVYKIMS